jgi:GNAT superfamily N-acetyltransferase
VGGRAVACGRPLLGGARSWRRVGFGELEAEREGDVGIVVFGLVPEFIGKGFGGAFLTRATETAWKLMSQGGGLTRRVWVQTSSGDHPHALPNYEGRGFRVFRVEREARALESGDRPRR